MQERGAPSFAKVERSYMVLQSYTTQEINSWFSLNHVQDPHLTHKGDGGGVACGWIWWVDIRSTN